MRNSSKWLIAVATMLLLILAVWAGIVIYIDPFFQYHKPLDNFDYIVDNQVNMNPGLAKHLDYDSVILGSSMVVNFNTDWFSDELGLSTAKLPYNGAYPKDQSNIMEKIFEAKGNTVSRVFLGIDEMNYTGDVNETKYPITDYLYDNNKLNDVQYIFNKDVMLNYCLKPIVDKSDCTSWNMTYPFWWKDEHYQKALVLMYHTPAPKRVEHDDLSSFIDAIELNLSTNIIPYIEAHPETTFTIFYPPYSILYWNDVCNRNELEIVMDKYRYMSERLLAFDNVELFFFQNQEEIICDLNNYADYTHYRPGICEYMVHCFADGERKVTMDNLEEEIGALYELARNYDYEAIWDDWYN